MKREVKKILRKKWKQKMKKKNYCKIKSHFKDIKMKTDTKSG